MAILKVPIVKGKANVDVDTEKDIPDTVLAEIYLQGLKVVLNRGMSKITTTGLEGDDLEEAKLAAMTKATENLEAMRQGKVKITGVKADSKVSGAVRTEAMRLARNLVKDELKRQGKKVSYIEASEITKAANTLLVAKPELIEMAKANLAAREETAKGLGIDIGGIPVSEKRVKAAEKAKAEKAKVKAEQLSATQAGKVAPHAKPTAKGKTTARANA